MSRRWLQLSLRTMLLLVTVCAVLAGLWVAYLEPYRQEQLLLAAMRDKQFVAGTETIGPGWLRWLADGKYAQRVVQVDFGKQVTDDDLAQLKTFRHLRSVMIAEGPHVTDAGLARIVKIPGLQELMLGDARVTTEGLKQLQAAHELRHLLLGSDQLTDDGLIPIGKLTELRELSIQAKVTDDGMRHLSALTKLEALGCYSFDPKLAAVGSTLSLATDIDFTSVPLPDAMEFLSDSHAVQIRFDQAALTAAGIHPRRLTVTATRQGAPLGEFLTSMLQPHGLAVHSEAAGLVVTTIEAAAERRRGVSALQRALPGLKNVDVWW